MLGVHFCKLKKVSPIPKFLIVLHSEEQLWFRNWFCRSVCVSRFSCNGHISKTVQSLWLLTTCLLMSHFNFKAMCKILFSTHMHLFLFDDTQYFNFIRSILLNSLVHDGSRYRWSHINFISVCQFEYFSELIC